MTEAQFDKFKALFRKFVDGTRWINEKIAKGHNIDKDKAEFTCLVVEPMDAVLVEFTDEDKDYWIRMHDAVRIFDGRIV